MQSLLFDPQQHTYVEADTGPIIYRPGVISPTQAQDWFHAIRSQSAWHGSTRMMYEREVAVPRLQGHYAAHDPAVPPVLRAALQLVRDQFNAPFNSIGLNCYRDQHDSVAPHNDKLHQLQPGQPIVLLSLGATRPMIIRRKLPPHHRLELALEAGSLLLMGWNAQLHYDHGIPKLAYAVGERISVAFRVRPMRSAPDGAQDQMP